MVHPTNQRLFTYYLRYAYGPRFKVFVDSHNPTNSFHHSYRILESAFEGHLQRLQCEHPRH